MFHLHQTPRKSWFILIKLPIYSTCMLSSLYISKTWQLISYLKISNIVQSSFICYFPTSLYQVTSIYFYILDKSKYKSYIFGKFYD